MMAQITVNSLSRQNKERNRVHEVIEGTYTFFEEGGKKYMQIDTYGRKDRVSEKKTSQVIQIDQETALFLLSEFAQEYSSLK